MGLVNWFRGTNTSQASNHQLSSEYSFLFSPTSAGRTVTERSAMQMPAVYSCVRILAETIASLPLQSTAPRRTARRSKPPITRSTGCCTMNHPRR